MDDCGFIQRLRQYKIFGMAILDWLLTILGAWLWSTYIAPKTPFWQIMLLAVVLAIATHYFLNIPTQLNYYLGLSALPIRQACN